MCRVKTEPRKKNMTRKDEPANSQECLSAYSTNEVSGASKRKCDRVGKWSWGQTAVGHNF